MIWRGVSIWGGFAIGFKGYGEDAGFGKDLRKDIEDCERMIDLERICKMFSRIWRGFLIWEGFV